MNDQELNKRLSLLFRRYLLLICIQSYWILSLPILPLSRWLYQDSVLCLW